MNPQIIVEYLARTDKLAAGVAEIGASSSKASAVAKKAFLPAAAALAGLALASGKAIDAASSLNEQISASTQVFGDNASAMQSWAKGGAKAFGLSQREALQAANAYGNMFTTVGLGADATADMSRRMVQLAGDMASFHDQDPSEMLDKLRSGLSGEAEPLRRFGVLISEARVQSFAYANGIAKAGEKLTDAQKVQARYGVIMEDTAKAQGDYARTASGVANEQRTAAAETENMAAAFGQALLPVTQQFLALAITLIGWLTKYPLVLKILVPAVAALAAGIVILNVAMAVSAALAAPWIGTFLLVAAAVAAVIVVAVLLAKNWDTVSAALSRAFASIKSAALAVFNWIKANWPLLLAILGGPIGAAAALIIRHWDTITGAARSAFDAIRSAMGSFSAWIGSTVNTIGSLLSRLADYFDRPADAARSAANAIKSAIGGAVSYLEDLVGRASRAASSVASAIRAPMNSLISAWNGLAFHVPRVSIPQVDIPGVGKIGGGSFGGQTFPFPDIPHLARGGVLERPTLFLGGEAGREIVAPEALLRQLLAEERGGDSFTLVMQPRTADAASVAYAFRRMELLRVGR